MDDASSLRHHVVFAVAAERQATVAQMFTELGFSFENLELAELGLQVRLDWTRRLELISPIAGSTASVADSVRDFLAGHGDGVCTVVIQVPGASAAEDIARRYSATTRFTQHFDGEGFDLDEVDLSVLNLPLTFLGTNVP
jgi:4-hydroxyphenylpyruvate dioxygenase-like putative hemolysin